jgi:hypothetical protein
VVRRGPWFEATAAMENDTARADHALKGHRRHRMEKTGTKPKPKKPKTSDKEQSERFIKTARELNVDESGKQFKRAVTKILKAGGRGPS